MICTPKPWNPRPQTLFNTKAVVDRGRIDSAKIFIGRHDSLVVGWWMRYYKWSILCQHITPSDPKMRYYEQPHQWQSATIEISSRVMGILQSLTIDLVSKWTIVSISKQGDYRIAYGELVPNDCWLRCLECFVDKMNITALESLNRRTGLKAPKKTQHFHDVWVLSWSKYRKDNVSSPWDTTKV